ncbi:putative transcription factor interactor and regulator CCHC(Zn) family [Helianthus annuus]|uniref:Transcription factor interactor and regulator CCHC(Zn) family n=1 Tax=Helianthus annuus TaxID=4232 RepID=A0A9K3NZW8_HELAN|nr:putative transcription factor interactor and regulator CCHC(Zn) family [Helianthus annuus]KAJ0604541.1 putative transcription factor interactor and regulator CCHC(Zn) family [Helianthus annuus]KAJ0618550.1 putative transcription factor interactor and regulator CCHC(Zn) family [Helianthus annuus]
MSINVAKQQMSFLASILESYESLVAGRIGNPELTKEDYDQIDPEEMELIDIRWCLASGIRRAQRFMEITGRQELGGLLSIKLGFDKSIVTCFRCKQKDYFKRECINREVDDHGNPFRDDYYKKAIYNKTGEHTSGDSLKRITGSSSKEKSQALVSAK